MKPPDQNEVSSIPPADQRVIDIVNQLVRQELAQPETTTRVSARQYQPVVDALKDSSGAKSDLALSRRLQLFLKTAEANVSEKKLDDPTIDDAMAFGKTVREDVFPIVLADSERDALKKAADNEYDRQIAMQPPGELQMGVKISPERMLSQLLWEIKRGVASRPSK